MKRHNLSETTKKWNNNVPIFICSRQCTRSMQKNEVNCIRVYKMQTIYSFLSSSQSLAFLDMIYSSRSSTRIGKRGFGGGLVTAGLLIRPFSGYLARTVVVSNTSNISDVITEHKKLKHIYLITETVFCTSILWND